MLRTILVVEDDRDVLEVAAAVLEEAGHRVLRALDPACALTMIRCQPEIDLLFTDVVMSGTMNGFELAHEARQIRPDLRILYTSGYMQEVSGQSHMRYGRLIPKPWQAKGLRAAVEQILSD
jgi:CheY-like chemotaxis protein